MSKHKYIRFKNGFGMADLEKTVAEDDHNLPQYYVGRDVFLKRALDREDKASVFIGPKGVGKSAILQMVKAEANLSGNENRLIEIAPDDLAFNSLVAIKSQSPILSDPGNKQFLFKSLWDYVLCIEILRREMPDPSFLRGLFYRLFGDRNSAEQKQLLQLTIEEDGRSTTFTDKMLNLIKAVELHGEAASLKGGAKVELEGTPSKSNLQLLTLIASVAKNIPSTIQHEYYVLIDDLDLNWEGTPLQNAFLGAMFHSIRKLSRSPSIKFAVSMRQTIFHEIDFDERDKFSPYFCEVSWTANAVQDMVERRLDFVFNISKKSIWGGLTAIAP